MTDAAGGAGAGDPGPRRARRAGRLRRATAWWWPSSSWTAWTAARRRRWRAAWSSRLVRTADGAGRRPPGVRPAPRRARLHSRRALPQRPGAGRRRRPRRQRRARPAGDARRREPAGLMRALEPWVEVPLQTFLDESSARLTLLMTSSGQVVAQHGFSRSLDVMTAAALGAGIGASTEELARLMGSPRFEALVHHGRAAELPARRVHDAAGPVDRSGGLRPGDLGGDRAAVLRSDGAAARRGGAAGAARGSGAAGELRARARCQPQSALRTVATCLSSTSRRARSPARSCTTGRAGPERRRTCSTSTVACRKAAGDGWCRSPPRPTGRCSSTSCPWSSARSPGSRPSSSSTPCRGRATTTPPASWCSRAPTAWSSSPTARPAASTTTWRACRTSRTTCWRRAWTSASCRWSSSTTSRTCRAT